ncbi:MAG: DUF47 family protein [Candidatus Nezhaarchaeota archaeon]|nr:DUF47 family protein [Candidatus Nezhaarchaeota archaeon]
MSLIREEAPSTIERRVRDLVLEHVRRVCEAVREMVLTLESYTSMSSREVLLHLSRTKQMEGEADDYRRNVYEYLAKASAAILNREDWIRLSMDLDKVADLAYSVAYRVSMACDRGWFPPSEVVAKINELAETTLQLCEKLKEALFVYSFNVERALAICRDIEKGEEEVDKLHRDLSTKILEVVPLPLTLLLKDVCERMESMSDTIMDAVQDLRLIALYRVG